MDERFSVRGLAASVSTDADCSKVHKADRSKLPKALHALPWENMGNYLDRLWEDCTSLLVAVPVCVKSDRPRGGWYYEINVVTVRCDEHFFTTELDGEPWGWDLSDVEWFVVLNGSTTYPD